MTDRETRRPLAGSLPDHGERASVEGAPHADDRLRVVLVLRPEPGSEGLSRRRAAERSLPGDRERLDRPALEEIHSPRADHLELVEGFARDHGLEVVSSSPLRHDVVIEGPVARLQEAFGLEIEHIVDISRGAAASRGSFLSHRGPIHLPDSLLEIVEGVLGLDESPRMEPRMAVPGPEDASRPGMDPRQLAQLYGLPERSRGKGQRVAVLCFGGGAWSDDIEAYLESLGRPVPSIRWHSVLDARADPLDRRTLGQVVAATQAGGANAAGLIEHFGAEVMARAQATLETTMDIEIVAAVANEASIDVYVAPDTASGFYHAIHSALGVEDSPSGAGVSRGPDGSDPGQGWTDDLPAAISISWGQAESRWTVTHLRPIHRALELARSLSVPVCCASGDLGSCACDPSQARTAGVVFPASSPAALACGGTSVGCLDRERLEHGDAGAGDLGEQVWNSTFLGIHGASGGGVSGFFERPRYQTGIRTRPSKPSEGMKGRTWRCQAVRQRKAFKGRAVPDVAAHADPCLGYRILAGGHETVGGGTSAAAPFWAAVLACLSGSLGAPVGWLNALLYSDQLASGLRPVTVGDNDVSDGRVLFFRAGAPWNACTGLGSPDLGRLLDLLGGDRGSSGVA